MKRWINRNLPSWWPIRVALAEPINLPTAVYFWATCPGSPWTWLKRVRVINSPMPTHPSLVGPAAVPADPRAAVGPQP